MKCCLVALSLLLLQSCRHSDTEAQDAQAEGSVATGSACPILSIDDVSRLYGKPLFQIPSDALAQTTVCNFAGASLIQALSIVTLPGRYYEEHPGQDFRRLSGIGDAASISFELGGWRAVAMRGEHAVAAIFDDPEVTQETAIAILQALMNSQKDQ